MWPHDTVLNRNFEFACVLVFIVARSTFKEMKNFSGLRQAQTASKREKASPVPSPKSWCCVVLCATAGAVLSSFRSHVHFWPLPWRCWSELTAQPCPFCALSRQLMIVWRGAWCIRSWFLELVRLASDDFTVWVKGLDMSESDTEIWSLSVVLRIDLFEEEKGAEAFFSLIITAYSYPFCVQTAKQALTQWVSMLFSAYSLAEFLLQKMDSFLHFVVFTIVYFMWHEDALPKAARILRTFHSIPRRWQEAWRLLHLMKKPKRWKIQKWPYCSQIPPVSACDFYCQVFQLWIRDNSGGCVTFCNFAW